MSKIAFAQEAQELCTDLGKLLDRFDTSFDTYFQRGYNNGGSNPIVDGDISTTGATAAQIAAYITLAENIVKFAKNQVVLQSLYDSTINGLRTDI